MAKPRVLLVSSDPDLRKTAKSDLSGRFEIIALDNASDALKALDKENDFDVVATGLSLPGMSGVEFLEKIHDAYPKIARMIITGEGNFDVALDAVNKNRVFSFLTKPCPPEKLGKALEEAVRHSGMVKAESELFKKTLFGCVNMLVRILELSSPEAMGRGTRIKDRVKSVGEELKAGPAWMLEVAALLSHVGCVGLPKSILAKLETGEDLTKQEMKFFNTHPGIGAQLLSNIPRLEKLAQAIRHQHTPCRDNPPLVSRILRACLDLDHLERKKVPAARSFELFHKRPDIYEPAVVRALEMLMAEDANPACQHLSVADLQPGMVMLADMVTKDGTKLLLKGQPLSEASHLRLLAFAELLQVQEPICAMMPENGIAD